MTLNSLVFHQTVIVQHFHSIFLADIPIFVLLTNLSHNIIRPHFGDEYFLQFSRHQPSRTINTYILPTTCSKHQTSCKEIHPSLLCLTLNCLRTLSTYYPNEFTFFRPTAGRTAGSSDSNKISIRGPGVPCKTLPWGYDRLDDQVSLSAL